MARRSSKLFTNLASHFFRDPPPPPPPPSGMAKRVRGEERTRGYFPKNPYEHSQIPLNHRPPPPIRAALVDLSGTLHVGDRPIPGAIEACRRLLGLGIPVRFLTNTSTVSAAGLLERLRAMGFDEGCVRGGEGGSGSVMTGAGAVRSLLRREGLRPLCLVEEALLDDLDLDQDRGEEEQPATEGGPNCVVVGLAPSAFCYERMNEAFRLLIRLRQRRDCDRRDLGYHDGPKAPLLIAIHRGKYLRDGDGELSLGPGGFVSCLEEAAGVSAVTVGKPSDAFFREAIVDWAALGIQPDQVVMVGDDVEQDVNGALEAGLRWGILVRTGKYVPGDEGRLRDFGGAVAFSARDLAEAVECIADRLEARDC